MRYVSKQRVYTQVYVHISIPARLVPSDTVSKHISNTSEIHSKTERLHISLHVHPHARWASIIRHRAKVGQEHQRDTYPIEQHLSSYLCQYFRAGLVPTLVRAKPIISQASPITRHIGPHYVATSLEGSGSMKSKMERSKPTSMIIFRSLSPNVPKSN